MIAGIPLGRFSWDHGIMGMGVLGDGWASTGLALALLKPTSTPLVI